MVICGGNTKADFTFSQRVQLVALRHPSQTSFKGWDFSHDGLRLYFVYDRVGGHGSNDIWVVERESPDAPWGEAVNLGSNINSPAAEAEPTISHDELALYFRYTDQPGLRRSTRASKDEPWGPAVEYDGLFPDDISSEGLTMYFGANWGGGYGGSDIWMATRETTDDAWGDPVNLGSNVNNSYDQYCPSISSDNLALFFVNKAPQPRIHMCVRATTDDDWGPAVDLGPAVNGPSWTIFPEVSPDGSALYFHGGTSQVSLTPIVDFTGEGIVGFEEFAQTRCRGYRYVRHERYL